VTPVPLGWARARQGGDSLGAPPEGAGADINHEVLLVMVLEHAVRALPAAAKVAHAVGSKKSVGRHRAVRTVAIAG
jgi:hypothetical protein